MLINVIGSGNVASHLVPALVMAGHQIGVIVSQHLAHAQALADRLEAVAAVKTTEPKQNKLSCSSPKPNPILLPTPTDMPMADATIIMVPDAQIANVVASVPTARCGVLIHTSGATDIAVLSPAPQSAVLYPCQTFSQGTQLDVSLCPFMVEGSSVEALQLVTSLAQSITQSPTQVSPCNSEQRAQLHLAAVFASNFVNHALLHAQDVMEAAHLPFEALKPLVMQTIQKAFEVGPLGAQTGPAARGDLNTLARHEAILNSIDFREKEFKKRIYHLMSDSIGQTYHHNHHNE